ncbi:hypothetical protein [Roseospira visakhapatnamensis]|uniref:Cell division septum initiation protein DivIVA n=1 Tax=Roseospira visakhapatnamensis TaxID=390880 RepID=A0A7W6RD13_9PROT|nr:hypothetical protein [Roseospira visakhapatnamensis]MBB4266290.1 cell division septum initiation protein DivIVA [Roseospira visakhapatnamensis]
MSILGDIAKSVLPSIIEGGISLWGDSEAREANEQAAADYAAGAQEAADLLSAAEVEALEYLLAGNEDVRAIYDEARGSGLSQMDSLATAYDMAVSTGLMRSDQLLTEALTGYHATLEGGLDRYLDAIGTGLGGAVETYGLGSAAARRDIDAGQAAYAAQFAPYQDAGREALGSLRRIAGGDPSALTPSQRRLMEDHQRGMRANLAASGLRGAGRAGVAAFNEGQAALAADLYDQNRARQDAATDTLARYGYGASGSVAGNAERSAAAHAANMLETAGRQAAAITGASQNMGNAVLATAQNQGSAWLNTADTRARNALGVASDTALNRQNMGLRQLGLTQDYYGRLADLATSDAGLRADATKSIGQAQGSAKSNAGYIEALAGLANAQQAGTTWGTLASITANGAKNALAAYGGS